jgi:hypothetical protein
MTLKRVRAGEDLVKNNQRGGFRSGRVNTRLEPLNFRENQ